MLTLKNCHLLRQENSIRMKQNETNHDLLHIFVVWAATVILFLILEIHEKMSVLLTVTEHFQYGCCASGVLHALLLYIFLPCQLMKLQEEH